MPMTLRRGFTRVSVFALLALIASAGLQSGSVFAGQSSAGKADVTFTRDIAPILQRSCQK